MDENNQSQNDHLLKESKYTKLQPNVAAALSYILSPVTGVLFFLIEKEDKFVRFHAFQSILFGVAVFLAQMIAGMLTIVFIGALLLPLISIGSFVLYLYLMWMAYNNKMFELPIIGKMAKEQSEK